MDRWDASPDLAKFGVGYLLHGLLDYIVDGHFEAVQSLDDAVEGLEDQLFADIPQDLAVQRRSFELRKSLVLLRRIVIPMREVVNALMRRDLHVVSDDMMPYYQDVYDHVLRAAEWTDSLRDLVTSILETNLTIQGNRLNVITKKVTSWAAIIAVPTFITGFYGMNVPYPGFSRAVGLRRLARHHGRLRARALLRLQAPGLAVGRRAVRRVAATPITVRSKVVFNAARAVLPEVFAILLLYLGHVRRCGLLDFVKIWITAPGGGYPATQPGRPVTGPIGTEPGKETHNLALAYPAGDPVRTEVNVIVGAPYRKRETASRVTSVCAGNRDSASPPPDDVIPIRGRRHPDRRARPGAAQSKPRARPAVLGRRAVAMQHEFQVPAWLVTES